MEPRVESSAPAAEPSAPGEAGIEPATAVPADDRATRREALRSLAALIGEEVFY